MAISTIVILNIMIVIDPLYLGVLGDAAAAHQRKENGEKGKRK